MSEVKLIQGDCLNVMQDLIADGVKVDMVLTDPPYLMNYHTGWIKDKSHDFCKPIANDTNFDLIKDIMPLLFELLKEGGGQFICSVMLIILATSNNR